MYVNGGKALGYWDKWTWALGVEKSVNFVKPANLHLRASLCLPFPSHSISSIFLLFSVIRHHRRRRNSLVGEGFDKGRMEERRIQGGSGGGGGKWANGFGGQNPNPNLPPFQLCCRIPPKSHPENPKKKVAVRREGKEKEPFGFGRAFTTLHCICIMMGREEAEDWNLRCARNE